MMSETYPQLTRRPSINPLRLVAGIIYFLVAIGSLFNGELWNILWFRDVLDSIPSWELGFLYHHIFAVIALPIGGLAVGLVSILGKNKLALLLLSTAYFVAVLPVSWLAQYLVYNDLGYLGWGRSFLDIRNEWNDTPTSWLMVAGFTVAFIAGVVAALAKSSGTPTLSSDDQAGVNQGYTQTTQPAAPGTFPSNLPIFALVGAFIFPIVGVVLGHISLSQMKRGQIVSDNRGLALAGMVIGYVFIGLSFIFGIILIVALVINASRTSYY